MKICPVETELFHADRQTDRHDEANSRFMQFCEWAQKLKKVQNNVAFQVTKQSE